MSIKRTHRPHGMLGSIAIGVMGFLFGTGSWSGVVQAQPSILSASVASGNLVLTWTGNSESYELQSTADLTAPNWRRAHVTAGTKVEVPLAGSSGFFRVVGLIGSSDEAIEDEKRLQILESISQKIATLAGEDGHADSQELSAFLSQYREFEAVGVSDDTSVWARFVDGRVFIILNNRPPATDEELRREIELASVGHPGLAPAAPPALDPRLSSVASNRLPQASSALTPTGIPQSRRAAMFKASLPGIASPMLESLVPAVQTHGYEVTSGEAGLFQLMMVKDLGDLGVFYIDSHGGIAQASGQIVDGATGQKWETIFDIFLVGTSTVVDIANERLFKPNFALGEIGYVLLGPSILKGIARDPTTIQRKSIYCITPAFAKRYWQLGRNSFAYIDTCHSGSQRASAFRNACQGAAAYAGWTDSVHDAWAFFATRLLIDDLLGGSQMFRATPKQRPFDRVAVKAYMRQRGHDKDKTAGFPGAELVIYPGSAVNGDFGLLAPSIRIMSTNEEMEELRIFGLFDPNAPATVRIAGAGNREIEINPTSPNEIRCPMPAKQQPFAGQVTVIQRGHESNTVPLTEWRIKTRLMKYFSIGQPQPSSTFEFNVHVRADVHETRRAPHEAPEFLGTSAQAARDSTCRLVDASGIYHDPSPDKIRTVEWRLPGGPLDLEIAYNTIPPTRFSGSVQFNADGTINLIVAAFAKDAMAVTETTNGDPFVYPFEPGTRVFNGTGRNGVLDSTTFAIQAGEGSVAGDSGLATWEAAPATFAPDQSTAGFTEE